MLRRRLHGEEALTRLRRMFLSPRWTLKLRPN